MADALRALITFYGPARTPTARPTTSPGCRTRRRRSTRSTGSSRSTRRARHQGRLGSAGLLRQPREDRRRSRSSPPRRSGSRTACPGIRKYRKAGVQGITANAIDVVIETGDSGPVTPVGINLPERSDGARALRQQVGVAVERQRGVRQVARCPTFRSEFAWTPEEAERATQVERVRRRADDEHARGDRPRVGQGRRAARRAIRRRR